MFAQSDVIQRICSTRRALIRSVWVGLALCILGVSISRAAATTMLSVDTTLDSNAIAYQVCSSAPNDCSLRGAISKANADSGNSYVIQLPAGTYLLTLSGAREDDNATGDLDIKSSLALIGAGAEITIIDGNQLDRVLHIIGGVTVNISAVKITGGKTGLSQYGGSEDGAGLYLQGSLFSPSPVVTLSHIIVVGNSTGSGYTGGGPGEGGGLYNLFGTLALVNSQVISNTAGDGGTGYWGGNGGGLYNWSGLLSITNSTISGNTAGDGAAGQSGGDGGGLYHGGTQAATIVESGIGHNLSGKGGNNPGGSGGYAGEGGGLYNDGTLLITNSEIVSNTTDYGGSGSTLGLYGQGGGICNRKTLTIIGSTLSDNLSVGNGGGIYNSGVLTVSLSTIATNTAVYNGGGLFVSTSNSVVLDRSTVQGNRAVTGNAMRGGGGLYVYRSAITLTNDLIADNRICSNTCLFVYGPGIYLEYSTASVVHTTLARNQGGDGAGLHATYSPTYPDGRLYSTVFMTNSLVVSHTIGVRSEKSKVWQDSTLWGSGSWANLANWSGSSPITHTNDYTGNPDFVSPNAGNYHLNAGSAAIDKGLNAGVITDIDNQPRPNPDTNIPDLGADEYWTCTGIDEVSIAGSITGTIFAPLSFAAIVTPALPTPNVHYAWLPVPAVGQGSNVVTYTFATAGEHPIQLTVQNCGGSHETTLMVQIKSFDVYLPVVLRN